MKGIITKVRQQVLRLLAIFFGFIFIYLAAVVVLGFVSVNRSFAQAGNGIEIMVIDNGIHTDLVVPVKTSVFDWGNYINVGDYPAADYRFTHLAFGWGNRRFYMETAEWEDLHVDVAISAALGLGKSAMHVYYLSKPLKAGKKQIPIRLSEADYAKLTQYIRNSFQQENGKFLLIAGKSYSGTDNFYEANGRFSLLKTCNSWTNAGLKAAGVKTVAFAPVPFLMMRKLRNLNKEQNNLSK